jgi:hypothetical protein
VLDEGSTLHDRPRPGIWNVSVRYGAGPRRRAGWLNRAMQGRQLHQRCKEGRRLPWPQRGAAVVRSRCIRSGSLCKGHPGIERPSGNSCCSARAVTRSSFRTGSCPSTGACPHDEVLQHEQHASGPRGRSRYGLGQHTHQRLPLPRLAVLRQNQGREVHDRSAGQGSRRARGSRQGVRAVARLLKTAYGYGRSSFLGGRFY